MTDLERFRELMADFGLECRPWPAGPYARAGEQDDIALTLEPASFDLGYDYHPVFCFDARGRFSSCGSGI